MSKTAARGSLFPSPLHLPEYSLDAKDFDVLIGQLDGGQPHQTVNHSLGHAVGAVPGQDNAAENAGGGEKRAAALGLKARQGLLQRAQNALEVDVDDFVDILHLQVCNLRHDAANACIGHHNIDSAKDPLMGKSRAEGETNSSSGTFFPYRGLGQGAGNVGFVGHVALDHQCLASVGLRADGVHHFLAFVNVAANEHHIVALGSDVDGSLGTNASGATGDEDGLAEKRWGVKGRKKG